MMVVTFLKIIPTLVLKYVLRIVYQFFSLLFPVKSQKITFASYRSDEIHGNLLYVYNEITKQESGYTLALLFRKFPDKKSGKLKHLFHMALAMYHLATSKYFIIDDYYFPVYVIRPREGTEIIQLWHAAGALKKIGYSLIGKTSGPTSDYVKYIKIHSNYSKVIVSAEEVISFYAEAFNMSPANIYPLGLPRTDYFFDFKKHEEVKERFYTEFAELAGRKLILYAPTFRGQKNQETSFFFNFDVMQQTLGNEYAILVHLHPYINSKLIIHPKNSGFIYQAERNYTIEELLILADILITDYSSIIFDFSVLQRPLAFFAKDLDTYKKERGFYYEFEEIVPGPIFDDSEELAQWIKNGEFNLEAVAKFKERFLPNTDGKVSYRVVEEILHR